MRVADDARGRGASLRGVEQAVFTDGTFDSSTGTFASNEAPVARNLDGTSRNDALIAADRQDWTLRGHAGNDKLIGGTGADMLVGHGGNDTYRVDNARDVVVETRGKAHDATDRIIYDTSTGDLFPTATVTARAALSASLTSMPDRS